MQRVIKSHNIMLFTISCRKLYVSARRVILCKHAISRVVYFICATQPVVNFRRNAPETANLGLFICFNLTLQTVSSATPTELLNAFLVGG